MEWITGIATIIAALLSTWSISRTNKQNKELAQEQNQWNEQAATTAYNRGIEQWNRETDYSTQMSKLESAGINPALAFSSGVSMPSFSAVTPANGVTPPKMQAMDFSGLASGAQSIADYTLDKKMTDAQAELISTQKESIEHDIVRKDEMQPYSIELAKSNIDHLKSLSSYLNELEKDVREDANLKNIMASNAELEHLFNMQTLGSRVQRCINLGVITKAEADSINEMMSGKIRLINNMATNALAQANLSNAHREYYQALKDYTENSLTDLNESQRLLNFDIGSYYRANSSYVGHRDANIGFENVMDAWSNGLQTIQTGLDVFGLIYSKGATAPMRSLRPTFGPGTRNINRTRGRMLGF